MKRGPKPETPSSKLSRGTFQPVRDGFKTEIIAASIRNIDHVNKVMLAGVDIATIPTKVLKEMLVHPLTDKGLAKFLEDYHNSLKK